MSYQLGIDLGTTYTAAAVCRSSDRRWVEPEVVTLGTRNATVPSVLYVAPDGAVVVGEAAERRALTDPDRVVREFKRRIGDPTPVVVAGRAWAPEDLSARLVRWVVDRVAEREGGPAAAVAVTHPASWGPHKLELLARALGAQGLTVTFLAEPQAAALHYAGAERVPAGSTIAVYDLGGGTFDAAVVRKGDSAAAAAGAAGFGLLGRPQGLERLGGVDFDEVVFEHVREGLPAAFDGLDESDPAVLSAVARVRRDCTEAKEALSSDTEVSIPVLLPASRGSVRLHRSEFEELIRPQVEQTVTALRAAVTSAGLSPEQLTTVLLVGGSSRIPLVGQLVSEQLGRPVAVDADPKNAIAKGAALAVSPKPTASWPGVAIPPVPAGAVAGTLVSAAAPPARPARAASAAPPPGRQQPGTPPSGPPRGAVAATAPQRPRGPSHEPATSLLASPSPSWTPPPPTRPITRRGPGGAADPAPPPAPPRRRPIGVLVGAGGVVAAIAVVVALQLMSGPPPVVGTNTVGDVPASEVVSEAPQAGEPPATDPGDGDAGGGSRPEQNGGGTAGTGGKPAGGGADRPTTGPTATPKPTTTPPPGPTTAPPTSAAPPPVVEPPVEPSEVPAAPDTQGAPPTDVAPPDAGPIAEPGPLLPPGAAGAL